MLKKRFSKVFTLILSVFFVTNVFCIKSFASNPCNLSKTIYSGRGRNTIRTKYVSHSELEGFLSAPKDSTRALLGMLNDFTSFMIDNKLVKFTLSVVNGYGNYVKAQLDSHIKELLKISEANGRCGVEIKEQGDFAAFDNPWCDVNCLRAVQFKVLYQGPQRWD